MDITGDGAMEFFSNRIKVTTKWPIARGFISRQRSREKGLTTVVSNGNSHHHTSTTTSSEEPQDAANFAGQM